MMSPKRQKPAREWSREFVIAAMPKDYPASFMHELSYDPAGDGPLREFFSVAIECGAWGFYRKVIRL